MPTLILPYDQTLWNTLFGGTIQTPVGSIKLGPHQFGKLTKEGNKQHQDRRGWVGMIYQTITSPLAIVRQYELAENAERDYKFGFLKSFIDNNGDKITFFGVSVKKRPETPCN